jgi:hypothetical protein
VALSILQERLYARPQNQAGAGNSRILVSANDRPLLAFSLLPADAQLVFDRRIALKALRVGLLPRSVPNFATGCPDRRSDQTHCRIWCLAETSCPQFASQTSAGVLLAGCAGREPYRGFESLPLPTPQYSSVSDCSNRQQNQRARCCRQFCDVTRSHPRKP